MKHMTLKPVNEQIFVYPFPEEKTLIARPDTAAKNPIAIGKVIDTGRGHVTQGGVIELQVKPGDTIMYGSHSGTSITLGGITALVLREPQVLGILKEADEDEKEVTE